MKTLRLKIDFVRNFIAKLTAYFSIIILNFIFTHFIEIKIFEKKFLASKKFCSLRPILNFSRLKFRQRSHRQSARVSHIKNKLFLFMKN